jgi:hypothetical protein
MCWWPLVKIHLAGISLLHADRCMDKPSEANMCSSIVNMLKRKSVKGDERRGQGHTSANVLHQSAMWHPSVNGYCFYMSTFPTSCFVLSVVDGKIKQHVCIKLCVRLGKTTTKRPWNASWGFSRILKNILNSIHVSRPVKYQLKMMNVQDDQAPAKQ